MKYKYSVSLSALVVSIAMTATAFGVQGTQVYMGNTLNFTPVDANAGTTVNWTMPTSTWSGDPQYLTQFITDVYTYNNNMINQWQQIKPANWEAGYPGVGGIVWHFKADSPVTMDLLINISYYLGNWGGHVFDVYFSDENNWDAMKYMVGGVWDGGVAWDGFEHNLMWTKIYSNRMWGSDGAHDLALNAITADGDFCIRVDMSSTEGGTDFISMQNLGVTGTVAAETLPPYHQIFVGKTLDFTPVQTTPGSSVSWAMPTSSWNAFPEHLIQFASDVYTFNSNMVNIWQHIDTYNREGNYPGCGGIVWHFKSANAQAMDLLINADYYFGNWGGHAFEIYFSDENNWDLLKDMVGGVWDGGVKWDGFEHNPLWTGLYTNRFWGGDGLHSPSVPATTFDGDFWIRIDMSNTDGVPDGSGFTELRGFNVSGTIPAALTPGDANGDGMVDVGDLGILAANYGGTNKSWAEGDFNGDKLVDVGDLGILAANYGSGSPSTANFNADYAKAFGTTVAEEDTADSSSICSGLALPIIAGLALMGLMLVKFEE
jgi:hypothetical protein